MKKLIKWLKWVDGNILHWSLMAFIVATSLLPKFPLMHIEYTYIRARVDDVLPVLISAIFFVYWIRRKVKLNTTLLIPFILFWVAVFASFLLAYYVQLTIPVFNIGLLHSARRVQYMVVFFIASSIVYQNKQFHKYMKVYVVTLLLVCIYGLGQKFRLFPSIQTMNPAYVDGRLLWLNPEDRINSTFGGHFDFAAYLTLSVPIVVGYYFFKKQIWFVVTFALALVDLLYTAARSSFLGYISTFFPFLLVNRKFKFLAFSMILTGSLLFITKDMTQRFLQTVQIKTVYVNQQTGNEKVEQDITLKNLPAGNFQIKLPFKLPVLNTNDPSLSQSSIDAIAKKEVTEQAKKNGRYLSPDEINQEANELAKILKPQRSVLCDISCATRLQVEWPRAILAFRQFPILGRGPSSITEATDNDILRWLGETGIVGTGLFVFILVSIGRIVFTHGKQMKSDEKYIYYGFVAGLIALVMNGLYVDVFEASKVAYNFWLLSGLFIGYIKAKS